MSNQQSRVMKNIWALIKPYWVSNEKRGGWLLLATVVGLTLGQVYITVLLNAWNAAFYNALQDKNLPEFVHQLGVFTAIAAAYIAAAVYRQYFNQMLQIRWRRWMTEKYQRAWLDDQAFYRLQVIYKSTDNPDQRIADDIDGFTSSVLSLGIGLLSAIVTLASFVTILWSLSGTLSFTLLGLSIAVPGYMLWAALLYSVVGTWLTHVIGRRLVPLNFDQQRFEANFRFSMIRIRENAEAIAFYRGENAEGLVLQNRFGHILQNWWQIMKKQKQLTWFTSAYSQIATIFPIVVAAPRYFSGAIQLGGLMQTASAFGRVQESLSWLVDVYSQFASWKATTDRLIGFSDAIELSKIDSRASQIVLTSTTRLALSVEGLVITTPQGTELSQALTLQLQPGDRLLLKGPPGSGKTTFLRALAGLWPYGKGNIALPEYSKLLFIPQKPYLPILSLREVIQYPMPAATSSDEAIIEALREVGLSALEGRIDFVENWSQVLSPGEQQKLAFAKILLNKPEVIFLDEATSSVDKAVQHTLYELVTKTFPQAIIVSVGHKESLSTWHNRELQFGDDIA